jgi:hypothetical protein
MKLECSAFNDESNDVDSLSLAPLVPSDKLIIIVTSELTPLDLSFNELYHQTL